MKGEKDFYIWHSCHNGHEWMDSLGIPQFCPVCGKESVVGKEVFP